ncbi:MAG TPA: CHAT domain-containing protein [Pirellulales bacterium]|jgi:tetratricopeptide (TPR) repeat protein
MNGISREVVADARRMIYQGRYADALTRLHDVAPTDPEYGGAVEWAARALFEQGRIRDAAEYLHSVILQCIPAPMSVRFRLWLAYAHLYGVAAANEVHPWDAFQSAASVAKAASDPITRALATDLLGRGAAFRVALGWDPPIHLRRAIKLMERAIDEYLKAGDSREAVRARLRLAHTCLRRPHGDPTRAQVELERAAGDAATIAFSVAEADARLAIAELAWDNFHANSVGNDASPWEEQFERVAALYRKAGHAFGDAKIKWTLASVLLKYGRTDGVEIARSAADILAAAGETVLQQDVWKSLHLWHIRHGNPTLEQEARERSEALSRTMAFPLAAGIDQLAFADSALRAGQYGEAEERLRIVIGESAFRDAHVSARLILSNVLSRANRTREAIEMVSTVIAELERAGGSVFLSDARLIRATLTFDIDRNEANRDFERLLENDLASADPVGEAKHRMAWLWCQMESNRKRGQLPVVTSEFETEFDAAEDALLPLRTLEARSQLGSLYQQWGQIAFLARQWGQCGRSYTAAEQAFRALDLRPDLAFTLIHQGLVLVHHGRERDRSLYISARERFKEAEQLFQECGLTGMLWNALFYQGICDREEGSYWEQPNSLGQQSQWKSAELLFLRASRIIDVQRGSLIGETDLAGQVARMGFAQDKQEVYREGFQLAALLREDNSSAVQWLERMKGRAVLDALAATPLPPDTFHPLVTRDQELRERKRKVVIFSEVEKLQKDIDDNLAQMAADPGTAGYAALRHTDPPSWMIVREALRVEEALRPNRRVVVAQFYHGPVGTRLFGMRADWEMPRLTRLNVDYNRLNEFAEFCFRDGNGGSRMKNDRLDREWASFAPLIAPLRGWTEPGDAVVLIPHNELHNLPLHTLPVGEEVLGDRNPVTYAPSLSVLYHLMHRQRSSASANQPVRSATFGDPTEDRFHIRAAVMEVADKGGFRSVPKIGTEVTREQLLAALQDSDRFLYAGHGEFEAADGLRSGLRMANGIRLTAGDVFGLTRAPALVVLSGCVTGVSERRSGDELLGMVRALLLKGANAVVASQWKVPDEATAALVRALAQGVSAGLSAADALQAASKAVRVEKGRVHSYYWGGFVTYGWG